MAYPLKFLFNPIFFFGPLPYFFLRLGFRIVLVPFDDSPNQTQQCAEYAENKGGNYPWVFYT